MMTLDRYFDVEGALVEAARKALEAAGIAATEMFYGEIRAGQRVEILANVTGETGMDGIGPDGRPYQLGYSCALLLDLRTPIEEPDAHRRLRGAVRSMFLRHRASALLNPYLVDHAQVGQCVVAESSNEAMVADEDQDELSTTLSYSLPLMLLPGAYPIGG